MMDSAVGGPRAEVSGEDVRVVLVTAPNDASPQRIARALVEERLVACVNIVSAVRSVYRWQGAIQEDDETLLIMKTRADRCEALAERVTDLHPYDLPEVLSLPVSAGSAAYLDWVRTESKE